MPAPSVSDLAFERSSTIAIVDPDTELEFLHHLPVELMWGVGPVTKERLAEIGVLTIAQLALRPAKRRFA